MQDYTEHCASDFSLAATMKLWDCCYYPDFTNESLKFRDVKSLTQGYTIKTSDVGIWIQVHDRSPYAEEMTRQLTQ